MADLVKVRLYPDPVLRERAGPVTQFDPTISSLIERMAQTMYDSKGVGLAAPQIGVSLRVVVADVGEGLTAVVNPEIVEDNGEESMEEGCLSVPGAQVEIPRTRSIVVKGLDGEGRELTLRAENLLARVIQHEVDHLNGVLIIDSIPGEERLRFEMEYSRGLTRIKPPPSGGIL